MSDNEEIGKKSGYRLEYASSARAKCKGPKPCAGSTIGKGELRLGSIVDFRGNTSFAWRHWGCTTPKIISNMKASFESADELDGFEDLKDEDRERIRKAWEDGKVADEDIPGTARKPADGEEEDEDEKPKKKRAPKKKKDETEADEEEKPKKAGARKPRAKKAAVSDGEAATEDEKPKKRAPAKKPAVEKKAPAKKRAPKKKKVDSDESGEDFGDEIGAVEDDDEEAKLTDEEETRKKRKRPVSKAKASKPPSSRAKKAKVVVEEDEE